MSDPGYPPGVTGNEPCLNSYTDAEELEIRQRVRDLAIRRLTDDDTMPLIDMFAEDDGTLLIAFRQFMYAEWRTGNKFARAILDAAMNRWRDELLDEAIADVESDSREPIMDDGWRGDE